MSRPRFAFTISIILLTIIGALVFFYEQHKPNIWPEWEAFKRYYISEDGRVIDTSSPKHITTSEGQSYGMFFALVARDRSTFDKLLQWTQNNLAQGNLAQHLPAWLWGQNEEKHWNVLDTNSATDANLWLAYDLLEASRIWQAPQYAAQGRALLNHTAKATLANLPGFGLLLLPGQTGFQHNDTWTVNPSYFPPQLMKRFAALGAIWPKLQKNSLRFLIASSPQGFAPDWILWSAKTSSWQPNTQDPNIGSYNAIRVYLWVGLLADDSSEKALLIRHFQPMIQLTEQQGFPPESVNTVSGKSTGHGPIGFFAALLPMMAHHPIMQSLRNSREPIISLKTGYYNSVLILFGQGFEQGYYQFNNNGTLK